MARLFSETVSTNGGWNGGWNGAWNGGWNGPWNGGWNGGWDGPWKRPRAASAQAATLLREGVIDPADVAQLARPQPPLGDMGIARWDRWSAPVLLELLHHELMGPLDFRIDTAQHTVAWHDRNATGALVLSVPARTFPLPPGELQSVLAAAQLREERAAEIVEQADAISPAFVPLWPIAPQRLPMTMLLLDAVSALVTATVMPIKHAFGDWRPHELSPQVQPMIEPPGHASYPAGHAAQARAVATVLQGLWAGLPQPDADRLGRLSGRVADRVGWNRVVAGLHAPSDVEAGDTMGRALGAWVLVRAGVPTRTPTPPAPPTAQQADALVNAAGLTLMQQVARRAWLEWTSLWSGQALPAPAAGSGTGAAQ